MLRPTGRSRKFNDPIPLPKGKPLVTLRDAAHYITKLPKAEYDAPEWEAAIGGFASRCRARRANDACAYRRHAGVESGREKRFQTSAKGSSRGDGGGRNIVRYACR
jgi:hypothetical protein